MVNAPVFAMEQIIANSLPEGSVFVGTREMRETLEKISNVTLEDFEKNYYADFIKSKFNGLKLQLQFAFDQFKTPYRLGQTIPNEESNKILLDLIKKHPPILSVDNDKSMAKKMTIFAKPDSDEPWLTIDEKNREDYDWMFQGPFHPTGSTHYVAIDLKALADYGKLDKM